MLAVLAVLTVLASGASGASGRLAAKTLLTAAPEAKGGEAAGEVLCWLLVRRYPYLYTYE